MGENAIARFHNGKAIIFVDQSEFIFAVMAVAAGLFVAGAMLGSLLTASGNKSGKSRTQPYRKPN